VVRRHLDGLFNNHSPSLPEDFAAVKRPHCLSNLGLFQNPVGFGQALGKIGQRPGFSAKFREAVPKTEVLKQPHGQKRYPQHLQQAGGGEQGRRDTDRGVTGAGVSVKIRHSYRILTFDFLLCKNST
jgi:hypothetical protein